MRGRKIAGNGKPVSDHFGYRNASEPGHFPGVRCDRNRNRRIPARQFGRMSGERVDSVGIQDQGNVQGSHQFPNQSKRLFVVSDTRSQGHNGFALDQRFAKDGLGVRRQGSIGCFGQGHGHDFRHVACHDGQDAGRNRRGHESRAGLKRRPRGHRHSPALALGASNDQNRAVVALVGFVVAGKDRVGKAVSIQQLDRILGSIHQFGGVADVGDNDFTGHVACRGKYKAMFQCRERHREVGFDRGSSNIGAVRRRTPMGHRPKRWMQLESRLR